MHRNFWPCLVWVIICLLVAAASGWVTGHGDQIWYQQLVKPSYNPPSWVFGPVWTVLYIMIGFSGGLLWVARSELKAAFVWYLVQLVFNFAWSFVFFGAHAVGWALVNIVLLWLSILVTICVSYKRKPAVSWLLVPYWLWVSFAAVLNSSIYALNH